jgi:hypothetical protein
MGEIANDSKSNSKSISELYEGLESALVHAENIEPIHAPVFSYLYKLYQQGKDTFLPWYDYNRICCDQCYKELGRKEPCTSDWRCILCAKTPLLPLSESMEQYDDLCLFRYHEMIREMLPMVQEENRQRQRVNQYNDWGIVTPTTSDSTDPGFPPVD